MALRIFLAIAMLLALGQFALAGEVQPLDSPVRIPFKDEPVIGDPFGGSGGSTNILCCTIKCPPTYQIDVNGFPVTAILSNCIVTMEGNRARVTCFYSHPVLQNGARAIDMGYCL
jgi:hypothetical protein